VLIDNIGLLVTNDPDAGSGDLGERVGAAVAIDEAGTVAWIGAAGSAPEATSGGRIDAGGRCVIPGFVDAHTHLVFAGDRAGEFTARLQGRPYEAGGIRSTVDATRKASGADLLARTRHLAREALRAGTTTLEVKSGYGLTVADERKQLRVANAVEAPSLPRVVPTFLGAHVVPWEYEGRADDYVALVTGEMLDACAPLAAGCDVFCERGAFNADQARAVLAAGRQRGLDVRIHANQLETGPGAAIAAELEAASADHLTHVTDADIDGLATAGVVATLLPAAELCTRSPHAPAGRLLDAGATVALATDCNPGTSYTTSMPFVIALACLGMDMTPADALAAATVGGARALRRDDVGRLKPGLRGDLVVLDAPHYVHLAYRPGVLLTHAVVKDGHLAFTAGGGPGGEKSA
jgi:imidazolonepropionase